MLVAILSLGGIGLVAAVTLGFAAKKFAVEVDPRELAILEVLPNVNCGACGYPGCAGFAKALASGEADPNQCPPGGAEVAAKVANILGVEVVYVEPQVAVVLCQGDNTRAQNRYRYLGLTDCVAAQKLAGGPKVCPGGCLGLATCVRACPFGAIEITAEGLAVISRELCTGCRKCIAVCPRQVIKMAPLKTSVHVLCNSHDKGAQVRKYCQIGCIGCHICQKTVPEAYLIENFLARVNYDNPEEAEAAVEKCPTHCIRDFADQYPAGSSFPPSVVDVKSTAA